MSQSQTIDQRLMELAAKATGHILKIQKFCSDGSVTYFGTGGTMNNHWDPLNNDAHAFRLLMIIFKKLASDQRTEIALAMHLGDIDRARYTIVLMAAEVGRDL